MRLYLFSIIILLSIQTVFVFAETEDEIDFLFNTGFELIIDSKYKESISYFDKVLEIDPNHVDALGSKAAALAQLGKTESALSLYDVILEINPNHANSLYNKGVLLGFDGKLDEAISYIGKALVLDPNNEEVKNAFNSAANISTELKKVDAKFEISVYDSQGNFLAYYNTDYLMMRDHVFFERLANEIFDKKVITRDNQQVEVLQFVSNLDKIISADPTDAHAGLFGLGMPGNLSLWIFSIKVPMIPITEGDLFELVWTIFDPPYMS